LAVKEKRCPKCGSLMVEGSLGMTRITKVREWVPKRRGKTPLGGDRPLRVWGCENCGYIEIYAEPKR
jgi:predicted nucleic-acid-binding Zn-ribbon protein